MFIQKLYPLMIGLLFFSNSVYAQSLGFGYAITPKLTSVNTSAPSNRIIDNSRLEIIGTSPIDGTPVIITLQAPDQQSTIIKSPTDPNDGSFRIVISFTKGPGLYQVSVDYDAPAIDGADFALFKNIAKFTITNQDTRDVSYLLPSATVQSDDPAIIELSNKILLHAKSMTALNAARAIHDWVASHLTYDNDEDQRVNAYNQGKILIDSVYLPIPGYVAGTALYTLERKTGVCQDFSVLFASLARAAGLVTKVISGEAYGATTVDHAWNEVDLDNGQTVVIDTTWDAGAKANEEYFNPSAEMFSKDHRKTSVQNI